MFAAAPAVNYDDDGYVQFLLRQDLFWSNTGSINNLFIDFGNGNGYVGASWATPVTGTYSTAGLKRVKIKIIPATGSPVESWFDFQVNNAYCSNCRYGNGVSTTQPFPAVNGVHSGGTAFIRYSVNNTTGRVKKPLIVAEGYDISSVAPLLQSNYSYSSFISAINYPTTTYDFNNALDNIGSYDLVFLDYTNGTDDIRRNAALLQAVVRWVNLQKQAGDDQNVVMGLSMGGLVARFGLAQMVANGENTQTRLLITHDAPHRGANVPLGVQMITRAAANVSVYGFTAPDLVPEFAQALSLYNAPATNQLLVLSATNNTGGFATNTFLDGDYRNMINRVVPYKMIATSQGAECGQALFAPASSLVAGTAEGFISPLPWISQNKIKTELNINALANQQVNQLVHFKIYSSYTILSLITINITIFEVNLNGPAALPYDGTSGGTYAISTSDITVSGGFRVLWLSAGSFNLTVAKEFSFVSTPSALDIATYNSASLSANYVKGVSTGNASRFSNFVAQEPFTSSSATAYNESHIRFTARNSQWLFNEMQSTSNTAYCNTACSPATFTISGAFPTNTCGATSATFTIPDEGPGVTYSWTSNNANLVIVGNTNSTSVQINRNAACQGCTITASYTTPSCGTFSFTKTLNGALEGGGGYSSSDYPVSGPSSAGCNQYVYYQTNSLPAATSYNWFWPSNWTYVSGQGTRYLTVRTGGSGSGGVVGVRVANACDAGGSPGTLYTNVSCSGFRYAISPNPTGSTLNVEKKVESEKSIPTEEDITLAKQDIFEIKLLNSDGKILKTGNSQDGKTKIDVSDLKDGNYFLHIFKNGEVVEKQQVIIQK